MLPPPRRENKGNPDSKVSASSVPIQDGAIKKKKKEISGYYIWVTKGRINQKEKKKENIGSEIPVLGRDLSAPWPLKYRCSAIQNLYEQHISTRTCISKVAIYYWRDISLNIREEFTRTIRIIGSLSSLRNFELEQDQIVLPFTRISISKNIIPLKLRTPHLLSTYIIYPKLGDARRCKAKRRRGEEREKSGSSFRKNLWIGACRGGGGVRNSANSRDKKLSIVADERKLGGNWSSPGQQSIETRGRGVVRHKSWIVGTRYATADRIEAAVSRETMARHNGGNGPALLKHRVIRWTKSSGERSSKGFDSNGRLSMDRGTRFFEF